MVRGITCIPDQRRCRLPAGEAELTLICSVLLSNFAYGAKEHALHRRLPNIAPTGLTTRHPRCFRFLQMRKLVAR